MPVSRVLQKAQTRRWPRLVEGMSLVFIAYSLVSLFLLAIHDLRVSKHFEINNCYNQKVLLC